MPENAQAKEQSTLWSKTILFIPVFFPLVLLGLFYRLMCAFVFSTLHSKTEREKVALRRIFNSLESHALRTIPLAMNCYTIIYTDYDNKNSESKIKQKH